MPNPFLCDVRQSPPQHNKECPQRRKAVAREGRGNISSRALSESISLFIIRDTYSVNNRPCKIDPRWVYPLLPYSNCWYCCHGVSKSPKQEGDFVQVRVARQDLQNVCFSDQRPPRSACRTLTSVKKASVLSISTTPSQTQQTADPRTADRRFS